MWWLTAIVGGDVVPENQWPDVAAVFGEDGDVCTGTLIAPDWVLTAGHCARMQTVVVDTADHSQGGRTVNVAEQIIHPDSAVTFDLSLVRLEQPILDVPPRALAQGCRAAFLHLGRNVTVAGFGRLDPNATQDTTLLHAVNVPLHDPTCASPDRGCRNLIGPGAEFIAGGDGLDSCAGDSGGPAFLEVDGETWLAGVVSRSALPFDTPCGDGGVYVRVDAALPWIRSTTGLPFPDPSCANLNAPPLVEVADLMVQQGQRVELPVTILDPDPTDTHSITVHTPPITGRMEALTYIADPFQLGRDRLVLSVADDGSPPRSVDVEVTFEVLPAGALAEESLTGCATSTPRGSAWSWLRRR